MGILNGNRVTRDLSGHHQNGHGQEPDDIKRYALSGPSSEAVSGSGEIIRMGGAAVDVRQTIYPAREVDLKPGCLDPRLVAFHDFDPQAVAPYNRLVISLISAAASRKLKRVLIASAQHGDGRTSVTLNLAAALARARQSVLVVESDFLRPSALRLLGFDADTGLAEAIARNLAPSLALVWLQPVGFNLLPTRAQAENSAELLASPVFEMMMRTLMPEFDFVLFDSAPLLEAADASLLQFHTDATLLVIRPGHVSTSQMSKAVALLDEQMLLGAVLNRATV
ncbi:MAG TPA: CpsD/CapB family tyrosine-protein kinase [Blastocatellia bacterium]|jgi:Mrp family chromosome partitioning ATPase|nr:CpsD/CapB family tyrosine-protein kinase [Blastocatellia bacterium]